MAYLLSKPDDWIVRNTDLYRQSEKSGRYQVDGYLRELQQWGYMRRYRISDGTKIEWVTDVFETPEMNPDFDPNAQFSHIGKSDDQKNGVYSND